MGSGDGQTVNFCVGSAQGFMDTSLHKKGKAMAMEKVNGG
jgi:hypothetical protein